MASRNRAPLCDSSANDDDPAASGRATPVPLTADTMLMEANAAEIFRDQLINRRDVAALGSNTVKIPGITHPPQPGHYYALQRCNA